MGNFVLILICILAGALLRWAGKLDAGAARPLNVFVIYLSFPSLVLLQTPKLIAETPLSAALLVPISMAWLSFLASLALFSFLGRRFRWGPRLTGAMILTGGLGNTSFVGFPILEALFGGEGVRTGIIVDQAGSFLVMSTLGLFTAASYSGGSVTIGASMRRIVFFPPFIALVVSALMSSAGIRVPELAVPALEKLAATLAPLALVSVGLQLRIRRQLLARYGLPLSLGLFWKLILTPALLAGLYLGLVADQSLAARVTVIEAAMAPMITAAIIVSEFDLDSEVANLMVGVGIPLSLLTIPVWNWIL